MCTIGVCTRLTPASEATHSVAQLHLLLDNCPDQPSDYLKTLCRCEQTLYRVSFFWGGGGGVGGW